MEISVVIPAYNKGGVIRKTLEEVKGAFEGRDYEIIVVDDGSSDDTFSQAGKLKSDRISVLRYEKNSGKGNALMYGSGFAKGNLVAFLDADLDLHPSLILDFEKIMKETGADIVIGSKRHPLSKVEYPLVRKILSNGYYLFTWAVFGLNVRDTQTGVKLFKREALLSSLRKVLCKKYVFDLELLVNAHRLGFRTIEAPVELKYQFSKSSINMKSIWGMFLDTLAVAYRMHILRYYDKVK